MSGKQDMQSKSSLNQKEIFQGLVISLGLMRVLEQTIVDTISTVPYCSDKSELQKIELAVVSSFDNTMKQISGILSEVFPKAK